MRLIIAGTRTMDPTDDEISKYVMELEMLFDKKVSTVVCGMAKGVDRAGQRWASKWNFPVQKHPANWDKHGKAAGPIRNKEMAQNADALLLIWDNNSPGSRNMLGVAREYNLHIYEVVKGKYAP